MTTTESSIVGYRRVSMRYTESRNTCCCCCNKIQPEPTVDCWWNVYRVGAAATCRPVNITVIYREPIRLWTDTKRQNAIYANTHLQRMPCRSFRQVRNTRTSLCIMDVLMQCTWHILVSKFIFPTANCRLKAYILYWLFGPKKQSFRNKSGKT